MGKAERTRQFIIETAAPIFNEKGIAGTTIDDILAATKMAKGGLYGHFESKEEIANVMVNYLLDKLNDKVTTVMAKEKTAIKKILAFIDIYKDPIDSYIDGGCPILNFGVEADDNNPALKQRLKTMIEEGQRVFIEIINKGVANGEISPEINAADYALKMFTLLEGGMLVSRVTGSSKYMNSLVRMLKSELKEYELK
ncbi:DNA-binding transcriptional regulator, AcrR family [Mucilaginibacter gossypiicola]|uniref:DNA-binding transcriptional regulator, AcrR family n=1 Tax=Mucilaginibacter gossypiicola TaxID=551995 RepID=A0A1H8JTX2_9SPHI|nr:TetR/AcrR family transcriptional regulator [Mucilaginibacter gossypiicola]SEN84159.1 DNA-binding transcriptional regulator, AcrR family [Mucilaginibacter gossypiicola]